MSRLDEALRLIYLYKWNPEILASEFKRFLCDFSSVQALIDFKEDWVDELCTNHVYDERGCYAYRDYTYRPVAQLIPVLDVMATQSVLIAEVCCYLGPAMPGLSERYTGSINPFVIQYIIARNERQWDGNDSDSEEMDLASLSSLNLSG